MVCHWSGLQFFGLSDVLHYNIFTITYDLIYNGG